MKRIVALAHKLMDILVPCSPHFLQEHGLTPGSYGLLHSSEQDALLSACVAFDKPMLVGGTAVNSLLCARQLGIPCTVLGIVGDDVYGHHIYKQLRAFDVAAPLPHVPHARTGTCLCLVTPDGERTMRTCLAVNTELGPDSVHDSAIIGSEWLLLEGYFLTAGERNRAAMESAITIAKMNGTKIAFPVSAEFVVHMRGKEIVDTILPRVDLLFCNEGESRALAKTPTAAAALEWLSERVADVVITCGAEGAIGVTQGERWQVPTAPLTSSIVDTVGAGDAFAGSFLAGLMHDVPPAVAAKGAAHIAAAVIQIEGARVPGDAVRSWEMEVGLAGTRQK